MGIQTVGKIGAAHGVRGWVRVISHLSPREHIFDLDEVMLLHQGTERPFDVENWRISGKFLVAKVQGIEDRDQASALTHAKLRVSEEALSSDESEDPYWSELLGFRVISGAADLGVIDHLFETGANDVMCVRPDKDSLDNRERLIPYTSEVVLEVERLNKCLRVNWDSSF